jgi:RimJ/RimL family protein N-acetyltransferase
VKLVWGDLEASPAMAAWVADKIPHMNGVPFGPCIAGIVGDANAKPIAGVVFTNYTPQYKSIDLSTASISHRWLTRNILSEIFRYPFKQLGVERITVVTPANRQTSIWRFLERFPFTREGHHRLGLGTQNAVTWSLLASDWATNRFNLERVLAVAPLAPVGAKRRRRSHGHGSRRRAPVECVSKTFQPVSH